MCCVIENIGSMIENLANRPPIPDTGRSRPPPMCRRCTGIQNSIVCWSNRSAGGERINGSSGRLSPRCFRIFWMTSGSSIDAMIRTDPPHFSHFSISMAKTRLRRWAHPNAARSRVGLRFRVFLFFYRFLWNDVFTQFAIKSYLQISQNRALMVPILAPPQGLLFINE